MTKNHPRRILFLLALLCLVAFPLLPQSKRAAKQFVSDPNKFFVYVRFDHIGPGIPRSDDEPPTRIWLRLVNNCRIPIVIRANGVPEESPKDEVGLEYDVVANRPTYPALPVLYFMKDTKPRLPGTSEEDRKEPEEETREVPRGYIEEVSSTIAIDPGEEILFSMPINHVGKHWHVEIPFEFDLPRGKCCRDEKNGGQPIMVVDYGLYDLPPQAQKQIPTK